MKGVTCGTESAKQAQDVIKHLTNGSEPPKIRTEHRQRERQRERERERERKRRDESKDRNTDGQGERYKQTDSKSTPDLIVHIHSIVDGIGLLVLSQCRCIQLHVMYMYYM